MTTIGGGAVAHKLQEQAQTELAGGSFNAMPAGCCVTTAKLPRGVVLSCTCTPLE